MTKKQKETLIRDLKNTFSNNAVEFYDENKKEVVSLVKLDYILKFISEIPEEETEGSKSSASLNYEAEYHRLFKELEESKCRINLLEGALSGRSEEITKLRTVIKTMEFCSGRKLELDI